MRMWLAVVGISLSLAVHAAPVAPSAGQDESAGYALETIELAGEAVATFGDAGSDALGIEGIVGGDTVTALVSPDGEDCTIRFPIHIGESIVLRAVSTDGGAVVCEATLVGIGQNASAQFAYRCKAQSWSAERRCPVAMTVDAH